MLRLSCLGLFALVTLAACGGGIDRSAFDLDVCQAGRWDPVAGITTADADTFVELVEVDTQSSQSSASVLSTHGTSCTSAADPTACHAAIAAATSASGWTSQSCSGAGCTSLVQFFVTEKAGVVSVVADDTALRALLAPVDTPADAVLVAAYAFPPAAPTVGVDCTRPQARARSDGGFDVFLASGDGACSDRVEESVAVSADGTATLTERTTSAASQTCLSP